MTGQLLDVAAAAAEHRAATATTRELPDVVNLSTYTSTRAADRTRPYHAVVKIGRIVRVERFRFEADRDAYAAEQREALRLLAEALS